MQPVFLAVRSKQRQIDLKEVITDSKKLTW